MTAEQPTRRLRVSPVELIILLLVCGIFGNSVYNLFQEQPNIKLQALSPLHQKATESVRKPAGAGGNLFSIDLKCETSASDYTTSSSRLRLTGSLCKQRAPASLSLIPETVRAGETSGLGLGLGTYSKLLKSQISNSANRYSATVFTDLAAGTFSTDYIPLLPGKNPIQIEFTYQNNKFTTEFNIFHTEEAPVPVVNEP